MNSLLLSLLSLFFISQANAASTSCKPGEHWVRAHHRQSYFRSDGTFVSEADVKAHCQSNSKSYDFWFSKIKDGVPPMRPNAGEKAKPWTEAEKQRVIDALERIPEELWSRRTNGIFRMLKSKDPGNKASQDRLLRSIALFDDAFNDKSISLERVLAHELAHLKWIGMSKFERRSYGNATNWDWDEEGEEAENIAMKRHCCFVAPDGANSPDEDFANNVEYFLFKPAVLKDKTINAYNWIKEHFGDNFKGKGKGIPNAK